MSTSSKEIRALFFDMDNTIINTRDGDVQTCVKLNSVLNKKYDMDMGVAERITNSFLRKIRQQGQKPDEPLDNWRINLWKETLEEKYEHLAEEVYKDWLELRFQYVKLSSEVKSLLCELRTHHRLALITNGNSDRQWEKIRACDLESYFDCIVVSGDTPWKKPNPQIFLKACDELNVKPEHCIIIGDRVETDIEGGKNANLSATIWINFDSSYQSLPNENNYPDFVIKNVLDVKDVLSLLNQWQIS